MQSCTPNSYGGSVRNELTGKALVNLIGKVGYSWSNTDDIISYSNTDKDFIPPTEAEIDAEIIRLQADYDAKKYQRDRRPEYPSIGDQLDMLYHAIDAGKVNKTSDFYKALKAVKDKHPKG